MTDITELPVVHENLLMIELVKQYGQIMVTYLQSGKDCTPLSMDKAMKTLEHYMKEVGK